MRVAEVLPGAEGAPGAGEHQHARLRRAARATASVISRRIAAFSPFITSGRFRVTVATSSSTVKRIVS